MVGADEAIRVGIDGFGDIDHAIAEGSVLRLSESTAVVIRAVQLSSESGGYVTDWSVSADFFENRSMVKRGDIPPNSPLFYGDTGVYVRDLRAYPRKMVLVEISREPGVLWALAGGVLFMIGSISLIVLKMKREGQQDKSLQ